MTRFAQPFVAHLTIQGGGQAGAAGERVAGRRAFVPDSFVPERACRPPRALRTGTVARRAGRDAAPGAAL